MKTPKLFISYRRDGGDALAFLLYDRLTQKGYSVFYDIESLHAGKFDQRIFSEIETCDHFILVLSAGALDRCVNENDWVRWEITHALEYKKNIVPVMMRGFTFPENLPEEIAEISSINGVLFESMSLMDARIEQLMTFLSPVESNIVLQNPLLERAFMALEDGEWEKADDFCAHRCGRHAGVFLRGLSLVAQSGTSADGHCLRVTDHRVDVAFRQRYTAMDPFARYWSVSAVGSGKICAYRAVCAHDRT